MKKIFLVALLAFMSISTFACWMTQYNFNNVYIAGVNFYQSHYDGKSNELSQSVFKNGQSVSLPLTVWFKVQPLTYFSNGSEEKVDIRETILYYKVIPYVEGQSGYDYSNQKYVWRIAKEIDMGDTPQWRMDFSAPVQLFGRSTITKKMIERDNGYTIKKNDMIILAWYVAGSGDAAITNAEKITPNSSYPIIQPLNSESGSVQYQGLYAPAYVISVIYNGKTTLGR